MNSFTYNVLLTADMPEQLVYLYEDYIMSDELYSIKDYIWK
jgi:hypothetical protein